MPSDKADYSSACSSILTMKLINFLPSIQLAFSVGGIKVL